MHQLHLENILAEQAEQGLSDDAGWDRGGQQRRTSWIRFGSTEKLLTALATGAGGLKLRVDMAAQEWVVPHGTEPLVQDLVR